MKEKMMKAERKKGQETNGNEGGRLTMLLSKLFKRLFESSYR